MHTPHLVRGIALVLAGAEATGKTTLARALAGRTKSFAETTLDRLEAPYGLAEALADAPDTLIVEGLPTRDRTLQLVKNLLSDDTTVCERKNQWPLKVRSPHLIFCTDQVAAARKLRDARRFQVVLLPQCKQ